MSLALTKMQVVGLTTSVMPVMLPRMPQKTRRVICPTDRMSPQFILHEEDSGLALKNIRAFWEGRPLM